MQLRTWTFWMDQDRPSDDHVAGAVVEQVRAALGRGGAPSSGLVVRGARSQLFALGAGVPHGWSDPMLLAGLSRSVEPGAPPVDVVGLAGVFRMTRRGAGPVEPGPLVALVFLEWEDCRWWFWRALLDDANRPISGAGVTLRATEGDTKPAGLGGWWSLGRRRRLRLDLTPSSGGETIH